jgi:hypothetical protein
VIEITTMPQRDVRRPAPNVHRHLPNSMASAMAFAADSLLRLAPPPTQIQLVPRKRLEQAVLPKRSSVTVQPSPKTVSRRRNATKNPYLSRGGDIRLAACACLACSGVRGGRVVRSANAK